MICSLTPYIAVFLLELCGCHTYDAWILVDPSSCTWRNLTIKTKKIINPKQHCDRNLHISIFRFLGLYQIQEQANRWMNKMITVDTFPWLIDEIRSVAVSTPCATTTWTSHWGAGKENTIEIWNFNLASNYIVTASLQCVPDISRSCISRNWMYHGRMLDSTDFANFADVAPKSEIFFREIRSPQ